MTLKTTQHEALASQGVRWKWAAPSPGDRSQARGPKASAMAGLAAAGLMASAALAPGLAHAQFVCTSPSGVDGATATQAGAVDAREDRG